MSFELSPGFPHSFSDGPTPTVGEISPSLRLIPALTKFPIQFDLMNRYLSSGLSLHWRRVLGGLGAALLTAAPLPSRADDWPQWRGPGRDGVSRETGLLQQWPTDGPRLVWRITDAGGGYSTPSVVGASFYLLGNEGLENEFVQARRVSDGSVIWTTRLGPVGNPKQQPSYPGARSTPTVEGDVLYALGSDGDLACVELATGQIRWRRQIRTEFGGKPGVWAYSESPLVAGDLVICAPGGSEATVLALDKSSGEVRWKSALPEADEAAFASAIVVEAAGRRQIVQLLQKGLVGLDPANGKLLWRFSKPVSRYGANIPTPLAHHEYVYAASAGTGGGAVRLVSSDGTAGFEEAYFESKLPTAIGGSVAVGDALYGTTAQALLCFNVATGALHWEERALGAASLCLADGRLYLHGENGEVALVEPSLEGYREKGRFTPPDRPPSSSPMEKSWAYPVVANGRLYLRDLQTVWCYDLRR